MGEFENFRCKYYKKMGYAPCKAQIKVVFPNNDNSVCLLKAKDEHRHENIEEEKHTKMYIWKDHPEDDRIVKLGVEHNDFPSEIKFALRIWQQLKMMVVF